MLNQNCFSEVLQPFQVKMNVRMAGLATTRTGVRTSSLVIPRTCAKRVASPMGRHARLGKIEHRLGNRSVQFQRLDPSLAAHWRLARLVVFRRGNRVLRLPNGTQAA